LKKTALLKICVYLPEIQLNFRFHLDNQNAKTPLSTKEMGLYNSTMAISTGFTVGLNVNKQLPFQYQT
jgi:hypothetical protein